MKVETSRPARCNFVVGHVEGAAAAAVVVEQPSCVAAFGKSRLMPFENSMVDELQRREQFEPVEI